jgi:muramoyltetrapeptide carboxypeptidase
MITFENHPPIFPQKLKKGDLIALVFPATYIEEEKAEEILEKKIKWLIDKGYEVLLYPQKVIRQGYLAGTDDQRANALMNAWKNKKVKAIWAVRGGWGSSRILDLLDYEYMRKNPKIFMGMSDITALHSAISKFANLVTFLSPVLNYFAENKEDDDFDEDFAYLEWKRILVDKKKGFYPSPYKMIPKIIRPGKAKGRLTGGNLTLISSMCGTKWQLNTDGKILVLEDVDENIDSIDKMLWQIKEAGLLKNIAGLILCSWKNCNPYNAYSLSLDEVFEHYFKNADYPVLSEFPSGHCPFQSTIPLNVLAEINTDSLSLELLEYSVL